MAPSSMNNIPPTMDNENDLVHAERILVTDSDEFSERGYEDDEEEDPVNSTNNIATISEISYEEDENVVQYENQDGGAIAFQTCEVGLSFREIEENFSNFISAGSQQYQNHHQQRKRNCLHPPSFVDTGETFQNTSKRRHSNMSNDQSCEKDGQYTTSACKVYKPLPDSLKRLKLLNPVDFVRHLFEKELEKRKSNDQETNRPETKNLEQLLLLRGAYDQETCPLHFERSNGQDQQQHELVAKTIRNCNVEALRHLHTKQGISMKCQNSIGEGPLHWACRIHDIEKVSFLLEESDAILRTRHNGGGLTPLHEAAWSLGSNSNKPNMKAIEKLIEHDPLLLLVSDDSGKLPFDYISRKLWPILYDFLDEHCSILLSF
mmetsp:Transcript_16149/g.22744  ORF Transcript_16149/g.22744 Transcript_16149/m.22744 type:complete len:376 (+) Transcript_16149:137-1264(+)